MGRNYHRQSFLTQKGLGPRADDLDMMPSKSAFWLRATFQTLRPHTSSLQRLAEPLPSLLVPQ